ncbi:hypothetical protein OIU76_028426 [Salix suchowensis]|nr:hypothetical protein OIU76_028426 [Salix suchowensis]
MVCEAAAGVYDWQPVPKKHTSNRQPKIGLVPADLALGKDNSTSNDKSVEAVGNVSGGADLTALGSVATGSVVGLGLNGKPVGAVPLASAAAGLGLGLRPGSKGVLGAKMAPQRVNGRMQPLKGLGQGGHTGKGLQSKSYLSRGHGRNIPTTTAPR